jgi:hypothetical protein
MKAVILIPFLTIIVTFAYTSFQTDWSGGPGVTGPVSYYWLNTFSSYTQIEWEYLPGSLLLALNAIEHHVSGYMGSLDTGFGVDMNGDGDIDILSNSAYRDLVAWFENDGTGGGWNRHDVSSTGELYSIRACYPVDIDGDGDMDVLGAENSTTYERIYLWINTDGTGTEWNTHIIADDLYSPRCICAADVDDDGDNDIIAGDGGPDAQIIWYENQDFSGAWPAHTVASVTFCYELHTVDIDQDGDIDILGANWWTNNELNLWENADGTGDSWTRYKICNNIGQATSVCTGDIDGDNNLDIIATGYLGNTRISWFENPDSLQGTWIEHVLQNEFYGGNAVHVLDFDYDGDMDILGAAGYKTPPPRQFARFSGIPAFSKNDSRSASILHGIGY